MTAQQMRDCLVIDGADVVLNHQLAAAGLADLERRNGYTADARVREFVNVLARTAADYRARSAASARGHVGDTTTLGGSSCAHPPEVGTAEAGALLGVSARTVVRIAAGLGGRQVSGRWVFDRAAVIAAAARKRSKE